MEFCARLFERVLVLQHGQLCFDGSVRDLLSNAEILQQAKLLLPQIARLSHDLELEALALSSQDFIEALKKKRKT
jgi:energy-coupling factor transport system ATP-binding protein